MAGFKDAVQFTLSTLSDTDAWVVIYKIRRSWCYYSFSPFTGNDDKYILRADDYKMLRKISILDPESICFCRENLKSYEPLDIRTAGNAILNFYSNGVNQLSDFFSGSVLNKLISIQE